MSSFILLRWSAFKVYFSVCIIFCCSHGPLCGHGLLPCYNHGLFHVSVCCVVMVCCPVTIMVCFKSQSVVWSWSVAKCSLLPCHHHRLFQVTVCCVVMAYGTVIVCCPVSNIGLYHVIVCCVVMVCCTVQSVALSPSSFV